MENEIQSYGKTKTLVTLFLSTLYISAFTFGGGFVIVTFLKKKFVDKLQWIDEKEMLDLTALAQSSPGAIAVNAAMLVGWRVCGITGTVVAIIGTILPPMIILSIVSGFYTAFSSNLYVALVLKGMQAGVAAVILDVSCSLGKAAVKEQSLINYLIIAAAFVADFFLDVNVVYIILAAALIGVGKEIIQRRRRIKT
ncbi:MAG TPA: chromate transporter [Lachnospiraceae bacterium]|nr:chromate transporter [Lachnospiraceae bacterium]